MELGRSLNGDDVRSGNARRERRALIPILGLAPLERLVLAGADRERLLHGLVTGEVRRLATGAFVHGFFTSAQGRILADYRLYAEDERFSLLLPRGRGAAIAEHLDKHRLASRVEIAHDPAAAVYELRGELALVGIEPGLVLAPDPASAGDRYLAFPRAGEPGDLAEKWARSAAGEGEARLADESELERERIERGELRYGVDFGPENFPQETGREAAVSYNKGCFLGQEVVARIHYRGGVQKRPCAIRFEGGTPQAGVELAYEGRPAGRATSVAISPRFGAIGLGILHQRAAAPGTALELEGGAARVVALPFESS